MSSRYHLGCPIWSHRPWSGRLYAPGARPGDYLGQYTAVFDTVEGNSTFYALPGADTVARWCRETPADFRFCFKFPRRISHERQLIGADEETRIFLQRLAPLEERLGPTFLQLPPGFGPSGLEALKAFLERLPRDRPYAVEVRHRAFFAKGEAEAALNRLLLERGIDRVSLDSRALFSADDGDPDTRLAQSKKPRLPVHPAALGPHPLVRFIGHPRIEDNEPFLLQWVDKVARWLEEDKVPFVFLHTPNNDLAPELAARFHDLLGQRVAGLAPLKWPAREQLGLF